MRQREKHLDKTKTIPLLYWLASIVSYGAKDENALSGNSFPILTSLAVKKSKKSDCFMHFSLNLRDLAPGDYSIVSLSADNPRRREKEREREGTI